MSTFSENVPRPGYEYETVQDGVALTVSGGATPSNTSGAKQVKMSDSILIQIENGDSTDLLVEVFASVDGSNFDTVAYASTSLGASETKSLAVTPGPHSIKIKVTNRDNSNATVVTTRLGRRYR